MRRADVAAGHAVHAGGRRAAERGAAPGAVCGRYEGVDERVRARVDEEISIGDYVLSGGELPALVIVDAVARLVPGVVGDEQSVAEDSFSRGLLDFPHYTRPAELGTAPTKVPDVLLSGNHAEIRRWRKREASGAHAGAAARPAGGGGARRRRAGDCCAKWCGADES